MKLIFLVFVFWVSVSIEGIPKNYQQRMQSRSVGDFPGINWIYGHNENQSESKDINDKEQDNTEVIPIDEAGPNVKVEPLENFLDELKEKTNETDNKDGNIMHLLSDLNKTMSETSKKLAKVFVNKAWHILDFGALGTSRRTRNLQEISSLLAPFYAFANLLGQLFPGTQSGNQRNNADVGSLFNLFFPLSYLTSILYGSPEVHQKLQEISDSQIGRKHNSSNDSSVNYVLVIDNRNKAKANRLFNGKTPNEILSRIKYYLDKDELELEEKFYIVWKLYDLFHDFENDDETNLKLIKFIIQIGEDPRFEELFKTLKEKKDPEFEKIWKLFKKSQPKLNKKYLSIISNHPHGKIIQHPSQNCFIISPSARENDNITKKKKDYESDNEKRKGGARDLESIENYHICCIDDDNESKANGLFGIGSNDETLSKIEKFCNKEDLDPEYEWYIVLKLYKMFKNLTTYDKDMRKMIPFFVEIGNAAKFRKLFETIKLKEDPRFQEIWKLFKGDLKDLEEIIKSLSKKEPEKKDSPIKTDSYKNPSLKKAIDDKVTKDEKEAKKNNENIETTESASLKPTNSFLKTISGLPLAQSFKKIERPSSPLSHANSLKAAIPNSKNLRVEPSKNISWFHDTAVKRNALTSMIKDKVHYYCTKAEISYSDLEEVENLLKDPSLNADSRRDLITFVNKWYGTFVRTEHVKHKFDELVHLIRVNPEYNNFFETLNPGREEPRNDNELKTLLKPPVSATQQHLQEHKPQKINSGLQDLAQERNIRNMKNKVRQYSSKSEISYEDLIEVENLLKEPLLDLDSKYDLITFAHKWYGTFVRNEKMKNKFDEIVHLIKENPEHNKFFEKLNPAQKETQNNEMKKTPESTADHNNNAGASLDRFLKNAKIMLQNPLLDSKHRTNILKFVHSWQKFDNLNENVKNKLNEFIKSSSNNPENQRILETLKQAH